MDTLTAIAARHSIRRFRPAPAEAVAEVTSGQWLAGSSAAYRPLSTH